VLDILITMAQNLGAGIVAEGVETQRQALYLRERGVTQVQGFLFAPAVTADKYLKMVAALNQKRTEPENSDRKAA